MHKFVSMEGNSSLRRESQNLPLEFQKAVSRLGDCSKEIC